MGVGTSIFLIAVGLILRYAVTFDINGIREYTLGGILIVLGILGLVVSLLYALIWRGRSAAGPYERVERY
jgi:hypothetical protein